MKPTGWSRGQPCTSPWSSSAPARLAALLKDPSSIPVFHSLDQIALFVAARLDTGRACPRAPAAREEILHQRVQRLQRMDHKLLMRLRTRSTALLVGKIDTRRPAVMPPLAMVKPTDESSWSAPWVIRTTRSRAESAMCFLPGFVTLAASLLTAALPRTMQVSHCEPLRLHPLAARNTSIFPNNPFRSSALIVCSRLLHVYASDSRN